MKLVREHINEKFTEDSDSVTDMNIGMEAKLKKFIDENGVSDTRPVELLMDVIIGNNIDLVEYLLNKYPENINKHNKNGDTALIWAVYEANLDIVKLLLKYGANPNQHEKTLTGRTPIYYTNRDHSGSGNIPLMLEIRNLLKKYGAEE